MTKALRKLISIAGRSLVGPEKNQGVATSKFFGDEFTGKIFRELHDLLSERNGFFAFEGALRVFPSVTTFASYGLGDWNSSELWRYEYEGLKRNCFFFAEDVFGGQFCICDEIICTFDPETGQFNVISGDLEGWAEAVLSDYEVLTGYRIAHHWQDVNGPLPERHRLVPTIPFVAGGGFDISNLSSIDAVEGMRVRGNLARQIRDLPDGAAIELKIVP